MKMINNKLKNTNCLKRYLKFAYKKQAIDKKV